MSGQFRLGVVLRLRELAEEAARGSLRTAVEGHRCAMESLAAVASLEADARAEIGSLQVRGGTAGEIVAAQRAMEFAERASGVARGQVEEASRLLLEARNALAEAARRREVVERLRDRLADEAAQAAQRREDDAMSELSGIRHARALVEVQA